MKQLHTFFYSFLVLILSSLLLGCGDAAPAPTAVSSPTALAEPVVTSSNTGLTANPTSQTPAEPAATLAPPVATETAVLPENIEDAATPAPNPDVTLTIESHREGQAVLVAREVTISGIANPAPAGTQIEVLIWADGASTADEASLFGMATVDENGRWQISEPVHPRRTGAATLQARLGDTLTQLPIFLQFAEEETDTFITVNYPTSQTVAVAGQTLLIHGESRNLIDGDIQIAAYACPTDTIPNQIAQIEISGGNGPWEAQIILPETAASNCDQLRLRVTTGGLDNPGNPVNWSSDRFLALVARTDELANQLTLVKPNPGFRVGSGTMLYGTAVNPVDGEIMVQLLASEPDGAILAEETATVSEFGYWELFLAVPAETPPGEAVLRLVTGSGDSARETLIPVTIQP